LSYQERDKKSNRYIQVMITDSVSHETVVVVEVVVDEKWSLKSHKMLVFSDKFCVLRFNRIKRAYTPSFVV
jgi:hypothetical protein